jgi:hypothetical protein
MHDSEQQFKRGGGSGLKEDSRSYDWPLPIHVSVSIYCADPANEHWMPYAEWNQVGYYDCAEISLEINLDADLVGYGMQVLRELCRCD